MADKAEQPSCFVIMPMSVSADDGRYPDDPDHFQNVYDKLFVPAIERAEMEPWAPASEGSELIQAAVIRKLQEADLVLCDMSALNANVFFELGIRTALNKPVCMVRDSHVSKIPFDNAPIQCHAYTAEPGWDLDDEREALRKHLVSTRSNHNGVNELWRFFGIESTAQPLHDGSSEEKADLMLRRLSRIEKALDASTLPGQSSYDMAHSAPIMRAAFREALMVRGYDPSNVKPSDLSRFIHAELSNHIPKLDVVAVVVSDIAMQSVDLITPTFQALTLHDRRQLTEYLESWGIISWNIFTEDEYERITSSIRQQH